MIFFNPLQFPHNTIQPRRSENHSATSQLSLDRMEFSDSDAFDATGILIGMDVSSPTYWWVPELSASAIGTENLHLSSSPQSLSHSLDTTLVRTLRSGGIFTHAKLSQRGQVA